MSSGMSSGPHGQAVRPDAAWPRDAAGELVVGGKILSRVVDSVGGTPCYLYDRARITARVRDLKAMLDPSLRLHYAIKANPMPALVNHLASLVDGLDVASAGELRVALDSGTKPDDISFAGPGKRESELRQAHAAGVVINVESLRELDLLARLSERASYPARVALRVNLPFELKSSGMKMSGGARQFGIDAELVPLALDALTAGGLRFEGFHLFAGSQNLKAEAIIAAQEASYACALEWLAHAPSPPRCINLGGGFGIPYSGAEHPLDIAAVAAHLNALAARLRRDQPQAHLTIELGRYLVGEAGLYVCRVVDRKVSRGQVFLVADGGMHQHLAASGNFGQVVRKNYPVAINGRTDPTEVASVVGPLCTPLDLLADRVLLGHAEEGDLVVVFQSGAYGRTASPGGFLGHPAVTEALV
jgi:diaminopimelate decarboxylase